MIRILRYLLLYLILALTTWWALERLNAKPQDMTAPPMAQLDEEVEDSLSPTYQFWLPKPALREDFPVLKPIQVLKTADISGVGLARRVVIAQNTYDVLLVDVAETKLDFFLHNGQGNRYRSFWGLKKALGHKSKNLVFATNGGIFAPGFTPRGLYVESGKELFPLNEKKGRGNFYLAPNGVFFLTRYGTANVVPTPMYSRVKHVVQAATQSGPMLITHSRINPVFKPGSPNRYIRNGVGVINSQQIVFIISNEPVCFYEFARIFQDYFGCRDALYLDGAISRMYIPALGRYDLEGDFGVIIGITQ